MMSLLLLFGCNIAPITVVHEITTHEERELHKASEPIDASFFNRTPESHGGWRDNPDVRVCATAPVSERRVKKALDFWRDLGYSFSRIYYNDVSRHCIENIFSYNTIIIDLIDGSHREPALATTTSWIDRETREILKAKIALKNTWGEAARILEHELGHALGWLDYNQTGHIMHHEWSRGGLNTTGVEVQ
jgi:hypothetical protein